MNKNIVSLIIVCLLNSCGVKQADYEKTLSQCDSLKNELISLDKKISELRDSVVILKFPADQRYNTILQQIDNNELDIALLGINELKDIFPNSNEAINCNKLITVIESKKAAIKAEEDRRKALGFKVFKDNAVIISKSGDVEFKCVFSGFSLGRTFTYDYINDVGEYHYDTADKNTIYILASMSMTIKSDYEITPRINVCKIENGKLKSIGFFRIKHTSWSTYGAYIGNYSEDSHDFSKVNTVNYKIASQISLEDSKKPLVILTCKNGDFVDDGLTVEDVNKECNVIKIINRSML